MDIIYILVPLSIVLLGIAITIFFWAVRAGQFDDLESPAHKILFDDDEVPNVRNKQADDTSPESSDANHKDPQ